MGEQDRAYYLTRPPHKALHLSQVIGELTVAFPGMDFPDVIHLEPDRKVREPHGCLVDLTMVDKAKGVLQANIGSLPEGARFAVMGDVNVVMETLDTTRMPVELHQPGDGADVPYSIRSSFKSVKGMGPVRLSVQQSWSVIDLQRGVAATPVDFSGLVLTQDTVEELASSSFAGDYVCQYDPQHRRDRHRNHILIPPPLENVSAGIHLSDFAVDIMLHLGHPVGTLTRSRITRDALTEIEDAVFGGTKDLFYAAYHRLQRFTPRRRPIRTFQEIRWLQPFTIGSSQREAFELALPEI